MDKRFVLPLSLAAVAALAACGSREPVTAAPTTVMAPIAVVPATGAVMQSDGTVVTQPGVVVQGAAATAVVALRPGYARVNSITPITGDQRRVGVRMDDGTLQYVDTRASNLTIGQRVEITRDSQIRYNIPESSG